MQKIFYTAAILLTALNVSLAQEKYVLVRNVTYNDQTGIYIKALSNDLFFNEGINFYRKDFNNGNWVLLNKEPILRAQYHIPDSEFVKNKNLGQLTEMVKKIKPDEIKGIAKAMLLMQLVQSNPLARYAGIQILDTTLTLGHTYRYKVMLINNKKEVFFAVSNSITAGTNSTIDAPKDFVIKVKRKKAFIKWKPEPKQFHSVNIYRKTDEEQNFNKLNDVPIMISKQSDGSSSAKKYPDVFFQDEKLSYGKRYSYKLAAIDFFGFESEFTPVISIVPNDEEAPPAPYNVKCRATNLNVNISWSINKVDDLNGFYIYRSVNPYKNFEIINTQPIAPNDTIFFDNPGGTGTYFYKIAAYDTAGNEAVSNLTSVEILDIYPPSKPSNLKAVADTGYIRLSWNKNIDSDILGYRIYRTINNDEKAHYVLLNSNPVNDTIYIDSLPKNARNNFLYKIAAVDSSYNNSDYSEITSAQMPDVLPPQKPLITKVEFDGKYMVIHWLKNVEPDLGGYNVFRQLSNDTLFNKIKLNQKLINPLLKRFSDNSFEMGMKYQYFLQAVDTTGNVSDFSKAFPGRVPKQKSVADSIDLILNINNKIKAVELSWQAENLSDLKGFVVFKGNSAQNLKPITGLLLESNFPDVNLVNESTYFYQVKAYFNDGSMRISKLIFTFVNFKEK